MEADALHYAYVFDEVRLTATINTSSADHKNSYLDRINVSNARLAGLQKDLHMTDTIWNTGISTFYVGYLVGQLPGNLWLAKADPRWLLPSMMMGWSIGTICMPAMTSGAGFAVCRFFIGLAEGTYPTPTHPQGWIHLYNANRNEKPHFSLG